MSQIDQDQPTRAQILADFEQRRGAALGFIRHSFISYNRYSKAEWLIDQINGEISDKFYVVDYGCGVGDYGISFARKGCPTVFYDCNEALEFVGFRVEREENLNCIMIPAGPTGKESSPIVVPDGQCQLAIFGEVLEHLKDPLGVLTHFADAQTKYIYTSSYPYRSDSPDDSYWQERGHLPEARLQQPACRELLELRYEKVATFAGQAHLWRLA